jgi:hypothetical protein
MSDLDRKREGAVAALTRARGAVEAEERRQRELQTKVAAHKQMQERNLAQLDAVKRLKEATAAMAQVESARRIIAEDESELQTIARRLTDLRSTVQTHENASPRSRTSSPSLVRKLRRKKRTSRALSTPHGKRETRKPRVYRALCSGSTTGYEPSAIKHSIHCAATPAGTAIQPFRCSAAIS